MDMEARGSYVPKQGKSRSSLGQTIQVAHNAIKQVKKKKNQKENRKGRNKLSTLQKTQSISKDNELERMKKEIDMMKKMI